MPVRHDPDAPPRVLLHPSQEHPDLSDVLAVHNLSGPRFWGSGKSGDTKGMTSIMVAERPSSRQRVASAMHSMVDAIAKKRGLLVSTTDERPISGHRPRTPCPITPMNFLFGPPGSPESPGNNIGAAAHGMSPPGGAQPSRPGCFDGVAPDNAAANVAVVNGAETVADAKEDKEPLSLDLSKLSQIRGGVKLRRDLKGMQEKLESETLMKCERMLGEVKSPGRSRVRPQPKDTEGKEGGTDKETPDDKPAAPAPPLVVVLLAPEPEGRSPGRRGLMPQLGVNGVSLQDYFALTQAAEGRRIQGLSLTNRLKLVKSRGVAENRSPRTPFVLESFGASLCPEHPRVPSPQLDEDEDGSGLSVIVEGGRRSTSSYMTEDSDELSALLLVKTLELRSPTSRSLSSAGGRRSPLIQEPQPSKPRKPLTQPPADPPVLDPPPMSSVTIVPVAMFHQYEGDEATEGGSVEDRGADGEHTVTTRDEGEGEEGEGEDEEALGDMVQEHSTISLVSQSKSIATQGVSSLPSFDYLSAVDFNSENSYSFKRKAVNDGTLPMLGSALANPSPSVILQANAMRPPTEQSEPTPEQPNTTRCELCGQGGKCCWCRECKMVFCAACWLLRPHHMRPVWRVNPYLCGELPSATPNHHLLGRMESSGRSRGKGARGTSGKGIMKSPRETSLSPTRDGEGYGGEEGWEGRLLTSQPAPDGGKGKLHKGAAFRTGTKGPVAEIEAPAIAAPSEIKLDACPLRLSPRRPLTATHQDDSSTGSQSPSNVGSSNSIMSSILLDKEQPPEPEPEPDVRSEMSEKSAWKRPCDLKAFDRSTLRSQGNPFAKVLGGSQGTKQRHTRVIKGHSVFTLN